MSVYVRNKTTLTDDEGLLASQFDDVLLIPLEDIIAKTNIESGDQFLEMDIKHYKNPSV